MATTLPLYEKFIGIKLPDTPYMGPMWNGAYHAQGADLPRSLHPVFNRVQVYRRRRKGSTASDGSCYRHPKMEASQVEKLFSRRRSASYPPVTARSRATIRKRGMKRFTKPIPRQPKPEPTGLPSLPPKAISNIFCYFTSSTILIPLFPKTTAKEGYDQDLNEIRTLMEIFGETRIWALDTKDACCPYCVERMNYLERHCEWETRLKTKCFRNVFMRVNCRHRVVSSLQKNGDSLRFDIPCREDELSGAAFMHELTDKIGFVEIRHTSPENSVVILGLMGYERLELKWRDERKNWFERTESTRLLKRRTERSLVQRSEVCEEMGYQLPNRCPDYPDGYDC
ncbi:uncharacterized protein PAC_14807 [Phialocephala subalpina]|uniref:Uncharacterized protein n=1 Tax=Phialocephala subalpina TaxID=576137 RepID=A0A1L7XIX3_9HELO|nr:uncharacterized protein PAC_14807 [Phialocephala subalpina]